MSTCKCWECTRDRNIGNLAGAMLVVLADHLKEKPETLGEEWVEFSRAVAEVVDASTQETTIKAIGRLCKAAVELP